MYIASANVFVELREAQTNPKAQSEELVCALNAPFWTKKKKRTVPLAIYINNTIRK